MGLLAERGIIREDAKEQKLRDAMLDYAIYGVRLAA